MSGQTTLSRPAGREKPRVVIVFPHENLDYSPTTLNLYDALSDKFAVEIVTFEQYGALPHDQRRNVSFIRIPTTVRRLIRFVQRRVQQLGLMLSPEQWVLACYLLAHVRQKQCDHAIGIDPIGCWVLQQTHGSAHLLSLEISDDTPFLRRLDLQRISSILVQSEERYRYQFGEADLPHFYVQNAPIFRGAFEQPTDTRALVFCGTAIPQFGFVHCLEFLRSFPEFTITVQGAIWPSTKQLINSRYADLLRDGRLRLNNRYLPPEEMSEYLSRFYIGFCIYDLSAPGMNTFNYRSAPSGKLFSCYAAGVPVIASDIPGMRSVIDFDAGVLVRCLAPVELKRAVDAITERHTELRANCFRAAEHFSFDKAIVPFRKFLRARGEIARS